MTCSKQQCSADALCDNCRTSQGFDASDFTSDCISTGIANLSPELEVTHFVKLLLASTDDCEMGWHKSSARRLSIKWAQILNEIYHEQFENNKKWLLASLANGVPDGTKSQKIVPFVLQSIIQTFGRMGCSPKDALEMIGRGMHLCVRNVWSPGYLKLVPDLMQLGLPPCTPRTLVACIEYPEFPYIIQYELERCIPPSKLDKVKSSVAQKLMQAKGHYDEALKYVYESTSEEKRQWLTVKCMKVIGAFFRCSLKMQEEELLLRLEPPEEAYNKRLYRRFGSDRFLEVSVDANLDDNKVTTFLSKPLLIAGRVFTFFYCKKDESPQQFVFFAEKGKNRVCWKCEVFCCEHCQLM